VSTLIESQHPVVGGHGLGKRIPGAGVAREAVQQHEVVGAGFWTWPLAEMKAQAIETNEVIVYRFHMIVLYIYQKHHFGETLSGKAIK
jgi:hypothetical protein